MFRLLKPGGTLAITDNDPRSPVIQRLPKPIAMLMVRGSTPIEYGR